MEEPVFQLDGSNYYDALVAFLALVVPPFSRNI
jgi:hypothetical protein